MVYIEDYIFWIIPDIAENPRTYKIYRADDRTKIIAYAVFDKKQYWTYKVSRHQHLPYTEQLKILAACDIFLEKMYFYNWD